MIMEAASVMLFGIKRLFAKSLVLPAGMYPMGTELFFSMGGATLLFHPLGGCAFPLMLWDNEQSQRTEAVSEAAG